MKRRGGGAISDAGERSKKRKLIMMSKILHGLAIAGFLASAGVASAAGTSATAGKDSLGLSSDQARTIYQDINKLGTKGSAPAGFDAKIGAAVPSTISLHALPSDVASKVPAVKPYEYAMMQGKVLLIDPKAKKVVDIVTQ
jgi:hypothetical protein